jgi:hypothetical protein
LFSLFLISLKLYLFPSYKSVVRLFRCYTVRRLVFSDLSQMIYLQSVGFTGATGFILAVLWFISFGLALVIHLCCGWGINIKDKGSNRSQRICLILLLIFTFAAAYAFLLHFNVLFFIFLFWMLNFLKIPPFVFFIINLQNLLYIIIYFHDWL